MMAARLRTTLFVLINRNKNMFSIFSYQKQCNRDFALSENLMAFERFHPIYVQCLAASKIFYEAFAHEL